MNSGWGIVVKCPCGFDVSVWAPEDRGKCLMCGATIVLPPKPIEFDWLSVSVVRESDEAGNHMSNERIDTSANDESVLSLVDAACGAARQFEVQELEVRQTTRVDSAEHEMVVTVRMLKQ